MFRYVCVAFAILGSFLTAGFTNEENIKLTKYIEETTKQCMDEFQITEEDIKKATPEEIKKYEPCFAACVMKAKGVMDDKGMFDPKAVNSIAEKLFKSPEDLENIKKVGEICTSVNKEKVDDGDKGCDRAILLVKCFMNNKSQIL